MEPTFLWSLRNGSVTMLGSLHQSVTPLMTYAVLLLCKQRCYGAARLIISQFQLDGGRRWLADQCRLCQDWFPTVCDGLVACEHVGVVACQRIRLVSGKTAMQLLGLEAYGGGSTDDIGTIIDCTILINTVSPF